VFTLDCRGRNGFAEVSGGWWYSPSSWLGQRQIHWASERRDKHRRGAYFGRLECGGTSGFPLFSTPRVPTRVNSPADVEFADRDTASSDLTFTTSVLNASFMAADSVQPMGIHPQPGQTTGGNGPVIGEATPWRSRASGTGGRRTGCPQEKAPRPHHAMKRDFWVAVWLAAILGAGLSVPIFIASQVTLGK